MSFGDWPLRLLPVATLLVQVAAPPAYAQDSTRFTPVMPDNDQASWETVLALPVGTLLHVESPRGKVRRTRPACQWQAPPRYGQEVC
jgi:hypothetical protein